MIQSEPKCYAIKVFEKDKIICDFKIQLVRKQDEFAAAKKKVEKAEQKIKYHSKF